MKSTTPNANAILAQQFLRQSQNATSPMQAAIAGFLGARGLRQAEIEKKKAKEGRELEESMQRQQLAQAILGPNADPMQVQQLSMTGEANLQRALAAKFTPQRQEPVKLGAGEVLVSPTGEQIFRAPEKAKDIAQTKKFQLEAEKLQKEIAGGVGDRDPNKIFDQTQKLRKEFTGLSGEFIKQRDAFGRIQASVDEPSAAGDLAVIFNYMKLLDPGSVVREGEFATAQNAAGIDTQVRNLYNRALTGERLSPKQRQDFVGRANKIFNTANKQQEKRIETYTDLAVKSGLDPEQVAIDMGLVPVTQGDVAPAATAPAPPTAPSAGAPQRFVFNPATGGFD